MVSAVWLATPFSYHLASLSWSPFINYCVCQQALMYCVRLGNNSCNCLGRQYEGEEVNLQTHRCAIAQYWLRSKYMRKGQDLFMSTLPWWTLDIVIVLLPTHLNNAHAQKKAGTRCRHDSKLLLLLSVCWHEEKTQSRDHQKGVHHICLDPVTVVWWW